MPGWEVPLVITAVMVAFAGNSVMTRFITASGGASAVMLTAIRFASGLGMLVALRGIAPAAFPVRFDAGRDLVGGAFLCA